MMIYKIAYICDGKRDCGRFEHCHNDCYHTTDTFHTKYGIIHMQDELYSDRFEKVGTINETEYYMEVMKHEDDTVYEGNNENSIPDVDESGTAGGSGK